MREISNKTIIQSKIKKIFYTKNEVLHELLLLFFFFTYMRGHVNLIKKFYKFCVCAKTVVNRESINLIKFKYVNLFKFASLLFSSSKVFLPSYGAFSLFLHSTMAVALSALWP